MIKTFINKNWNYFISGSAILFGLFVLIPFKFKPYLAVLVFILSGLSFFYNNNNNKFHFKRGLLISILFVIAFLSLLYTNNLNEGWKIIGRMIPLLLPMAVCLLTDYDRERFFNFFKKSFVVACSIYTVLIFIYLNQLGCFSGDSSLNYAYSYIMYEFWGINDHPIYISSYFAIALFFLLYSNVTSKTISYILFLVIFAGLLILSRKGSIIAFLVCTTIFFLSQKMKGYWLKGILIIMFVFIGMIFIPEIKNRFFELLSVDRIVENTETSTGIRYIIWKSSIQLVENAAFFGYGIGDVQDVLNESYIAQGYKKLAVDTYNAHNQYIQIALTAGLTGLLIFLASNIILYRQFIKSKNSQGLLVLTFFLMVFLTESYLERQNGIIMYSFIMSMYIFKEDEK